MAQAASIDLQVSNYSWTPDPVINGGPVSLSITVQNNGPATSASSSLVINLPTNVTYAGNSSGCTPSGGNTVLTCPIGSLALAASTVINYTATGNGDGVQSTNATVTATDGNTDTNSANNALTKSLTSIKGADLAVVKTGAGGCVTGGCSAVAGANYSFFLDVTNNGPDPASQFRVTDNLPAVVDFIYSSASGTGWSCVHGGTTLTCDYSGLAVASGASAPTITVNGQIVTSAGTITNGASVVSIDPATGDPNEANNGPSQVVVNITPGTNLRANKDMVSSTTGLSTLVHGETVTLTLSATNYGTQAATGVVITDSVPANFVIVDAGGCAQSGQDLTCNVGNLAAGATSAAFVITLTAPAADETGTNTANLSRTTPVAGNNDPDSVNYSVQAPFSNLTISKDKRAEDDFSPGGNDPVQTGQRIKNTIVVSNDSSSTSAISGVVTVVETIVSYPDEIYDDIDAASSVAGWVCVDGGATVTCTFDIDTYLAFPLARGDSLPDLVFYTKAVGANVQLTNNACTGGTISNHQPPDDDSTADCSGDQTIFSTSADVDIGVTKSVDDGDIAPTDTSFTYTLGITNHSATVTAPTLVLTDDIPMYFADSDATPGTTPVVVTLVGQGAGEGCSVDANTGLVTCTILNLAPSASRTVTVQVSRPVRDGNFTNTVSWDSPDVVQTVNVQPDTATANVIVQPVADVAVTNIAAAPDPVKVGTVVVYTTSIRNNGPSAAANVVLRHQLPFNTTAWDMMSKQGTPSLTGGGTCVFVDSFVGAPYDGQAGVECNGFSLATDESRQLVFSLMPNHSHYDALIPPDQNYVTDATITTTTPESDAGNNNQGHTETVTLEQIDLSIIKHEALGYDPDGAGPLTNMLYDPVAFGDQIHYLVTLRNNGPSLATQVIWTDVLTPPNGWTGNFVSVAFDAGNSSYTPANVHCDDDAGPGSFADPDSITCYLSAGAGDLANSVLSAGQYVSLRLVFQTGGIDPPSSITYSNTAEVYSAETGTAPYGGDTLPANNAVVETTTVLPKTDLQVIDKTVVDDYPGNTQDGIVDLNEPFKYRIRVCNGGSSNAPGVRVTDTLPAGLSPNGNVTVTAGSAITLATNSCNGASWVGTCDLGPLAMDNQCDDPNYYVTIEIPVRAAYQSSGSYAFAFNTNIPNTASIEPLPDTSIDPNATNNAQTVNVQVRRNSLAGSVYRDNDLDDVFDAGEGIGSVAITLTGTDSYGYIYQGGGDYPALVSNTNGSGAFSFVTLPPGTWQLDEANPSNTWDRLEWAGNAPTAGTVPGMVCDGASNCSTAQTHNRISGIGLPADGSNAAINYLFQEYQRAQLNGYVYADNNDNDGERDGVTGINVAAANDISLSGNIYTGEDLCTKITCTVSTDGSGYYSYTNLPPSNGAGYTVTQNIQPPTYLDGKEQNGLSNVIALSGGRSAPENFVVGVVDPNVTYAERNFGELSPATISGFVFMDWDSDAVRDPAETHGVSAISVNLTGTDDLGAAVNLSVNTGASGAYSFSDLRPASYTVSQVTDPTSLTHTGAQAGSLGGTINGSPTAANVGVPGVGNMSISAIPLAAGNSSTGNNFGEGGGSLAGFVYADVNGDGIKDVGEPGIPNISLTISGLTADATNVCVAISPNPCTVTTAADGSYSYPGLPTSDATGYTLTEQLQSTVPLSNYVDGIAAPGTGLAVGNEGTADNDDANDVISAIRLQVGENGINYNFGEEGATLAGLVYLDANDDGIKDMTDPGLSGWTLTLSGNTLSGDDVCDILPSCTQSSDANGDFRFVGLPASANPAGYVVTETQHPNYASRTNEVGHDDTAPAIPVGAAGVNQFTGLLIPAAADFSGYLFGEKLGSLSGRVFLDTNNDGIFDVGESPIAGVALTLSGTSASGVDVCTLAPVCTTTTDGNGDYSFSGLPNANPSGYLVVETQPAYMDGKTTQGLVDGMSCAGCVNSIYNQISAVPMDASKVFTQFDFGELQAASLAGTVYVDTDGDAVLDAGETQRISAVSVTLTGTDDRGNPVNLVMATDGSGAYSFTNLRPGTYLVTETKPTWIPSTGAQPGSAGGVAGGTATTQTISSVVIVSMATPNNLIGYNFGHRGTASLSGYVYADADDDGVKDAGELGIAGVSVALSGTAGGGSSLCGFVTTCAATTDASGAFSFLNLPASAAGGYSLTETQPANYNDGQDNVGTGTTTAGTPGNDLLSGIVLGNGQAGVDYRFGELGAVLSGYVYVDADNDGHRDVGEAALAGVGMTLSGLTSAAANVCGHVSSCSLVTDINGYYFWAGLPPSDASGYHVVQNTQPVGYLDGSEENGAGIPVPSSAGRGDGESIDAIVVAAGGTYDERNFGELPPGAISGFVYVDSNNDGIKNPGPTPAAEAIGISGVGLTLTGTDDLGVSVNQPAMAGADGSYSFPNLRPGTYAVTETQPLGLSNTGAQPGPVAASNGTGTGSGVTPQVVSSIVLAPSGTPTTLPENNFGHQGTGLFGFVYVDDNNNGQMDAGEPGIEGVAVTLSGIAAATGGSVCDLLDSCTTMTDVNGQFSFTSLPASDANGYRLTERDGNGGASPVLSLYGDGQDTAGQVAGNPMGTVPAPDVDQIEGIVIAVDQIGSNYLFGELGASISGFVYRDDNHDGVRDPGEIPLANVSMSLSGIDFGLDGVSGGGDDSQIETGGHTDALGAYRFDHLRPGLYTVLESQPVDWADGRETAGSLGGLVDNSNFNALDMYNAIAEITVAVADVGIEYNFGERGGNLIGTVFVDLNLNGLLEGGEVGIPGVQVDLSGFSVAGVDVCTLIPSCTAITDAAGQYAFSGLPNSGTSGLTVVETQPSGYVSTSPDSVITNLVAPDTAVVNFGERPLGNIIGVVFDDLDDDGLRDAGEPGIPDVLITLNTGATRTTGADGSYAFLNIDIGSYTVTETDPVEYYSTTPNGVDVVVPVGGTAVADFGDRRKDLIVNASSSCSNHTAWLSYDITPIGFTPVADSVTIEWYDMAGVLRQTLNNQPMSGSLLWYGMALDGAGDPVSWTGWEQLPNGAWVRTADYDLLRPDMRVRIQVNPETTITVTYPTDTAQCSANPERVGDRAIPAMSWWGLLMLSGLLSLLGLVRYRASKCSVS